MKFTPYYGCPAVTYNIAKWSMGSYEFVVGYATGDGPPGWFPMSFYITRFPGTCLWFWRVGCGIRRKSSGISGEK